ncbi:hypothetical protein ACN2XU_23040 [Primorskyibacter sp. 2E107]|uniref:hypothetical protein n=1 Tax=Primorskyibacter sp. 2E107 TaxID=3403458 RepID=UPI003AF6F8B0
MNKFERRVKVWVEEDPSSLQKLKNSVLFWYYNKIPRGLRFFGITHFLAKFGLIASAPSLAFFVYERITGLQAATATGVLFFLFVASSVLDNWSKGKNNAAEQASVEAWVRIGDLITSVKSSATPAANKDDTLTAALGVIEAYARQITKSPKRSISVSLALYDGKSTTSMKIRHRNPGNERPTGRKLKNLERVMGHIACQAGPEPRVVPDLRSFGKEAFFSPTQSTCTYRSIVILPITALGNGKIKGFVSIDCDRPHAFHGNIADQLVVTTEPLINHIEEQF